MILVIIGTRPEQIKMAPVVAEAKRRGLPVLVWCTNQSPDLLDDAVLKPDAVGPLDEEPMLGRPDLVVVQGDTRTAFEASVLAYEHRIPVFHVEAGIRTGDIRSPWPEEGYRQMISRIATYHACATAENHRNVVTDLHGPYCNGRVTGNPVVESVLARAAATKPREGDYRPIYPAVITLHRRENRGHFGDILRATHDAVPEAHFVRWYAHPNGWAAEEGRHMGYEPLPPDHPAHFPSRLACAKVVVTDSGGVQEECNVLGIPCVVARTITDRRESLGRGGAILGGNTRESVATAIRQALRIDRSAIDRTCFGDGKASERIVDWFTEILAPPTPTPAAE